MARSYEASVRLNPAGPPVREEVAPLNLAANLNGSATALLLIHGYNVSVTDAREVYGQFLSALNQLNGSELAIPVCQFMWPGDESNKIWSTATYAGKIDVALE